MNYLIIFIAVIFPINIYSQRLLDVYEKLPKCNINLEKKVFDSSGNLRSINKVNRVVDSQKYLITEYQDINHSIHTIQKKYYRMDGLLDSIIIDDSLDQEISKYFYNKNRIDYIIKSKNGIPVEKIKYSYSRDVEKVKNYFYNSGKFILGDIETFIYHNNYLQERTVYSNTLKQFSEKAIIKRLLVNDTIINSVIITDLFNHSFTIDTISYKGKIRRIIYDGNASNRDEYTYLSDDSLMLIKFRDNEVAYFEKSTILFGQYIPFIYDDKKNEIKGEIDYDITTCTAIEKVIDRNGNLTIISLKFY